MAAEQNLTCPVESTTVYFSYDVVASGRENDTKHEKNVLDTVLETTWTCKGKGAYLTLTPKYDQGDHGVNQLRIAFGKGNERKAYFFVQESEDAKTFTPLTKPDRLSSSGTTDGLELFVFTKETKAKTFRIVFDGNDDNEWANVATVQLVDDPHFKPDTTEPPAPNPVPPTPEPPVTPPGPLPNPDLSKTFTKDGVQVVYEATEIIYNPNNNDRDDGKRRDYNGLGSKCDKVSIGAYFKFSSNPPKDEISGKCRGGKHSGDGKRVNCYDMGSDIYSGKQRQRVEELHPQYTNGVAGGTGVKVTDKFVGFQFVCMPNVSKKVMISEIWIDDGDNEGDKPANKWRQTSKFEESKYYFEKLLADHVETIRIDDPEKKGLKQLVEKWHFCASLT